MLSDSEYCEERMLSDSEYCEERMLSDSEYCEERMLSDSESNRKIIAENLGGVTVTPRRLELRIISGTSLASKFKSYARSVQLEYFSGSLSNKKIPKFPCHFL